MLAGLNNVARSTYEQPQPPNRSELLSNCMAEEQMKPYALKNHDDNTTTQIISPPSSRRTKKATGGKIPGKFKFPLCWKAISSSSATKL